jgi:hypothetical protein
MGQGKVMRHTSSAMSDGEMVVVTSDDLWKAIRALEDQPLQTIGRGNAGRGRPFTVRGVTTDRIVVLPSRGEPRPIRRALFDQALALGTPVAQLRPVMLASTGTASVCSSYVVGILRELQRRGVL